MTSFDGHKNSKMHFAKLVATATNLPSGTPTVVNLNDTADATWYDPFGLSSSATQLTIKSPGVYIVNICMLYNVPNTTGATVGTYRHVSLYKNAVQHVLLRNSPHSDGDFSSAISGTYTLEFVAGDVLTLVGRYQGTGTISCGGGPYTYLAVQQVTKGTT